MTTILWLLLAEFCQALIVDVHMTAVLCFGNMRPAMLI